MRCAMPLAVLAVVIALVPSRSGAQPAASDADARLRTLYTDEWNWRRQELGRTGDQPGDGAAVDRLPRVDAAAPQRRLAHWARAPPPPGTISHTRLSAE